MKGFSALAIGIVAILGVALAVGYMTYQNMAGTSVQESITETTETEESRAMLETVKRTLRTDLTYASQNSAMAVAASGGGQNCEYSGTRYWMFGEPCEPSEEEVLCALSNATLVKMNNFVKTEKEHYSAENVEISEYDCAGSYHPSEESCYPYKSRNQPVADAFQSSLQGGLIEVKGKGDQKDMYEGNIVADVAPNQFWPMYYTLKNYIAGGMFDIQVTATVREECPDDSIPTAQKILDGVEEACKKLQLEFCDYNQPDCYVKVDCTIECPDPSMPVDTTSCFQGEIPQEFTKKMCFEPKHTDGDAVEGEQTANAEYAQGTTTGSYRVKIEVTDEGHKMIAEECEDCYLKWNLYVVDDLATNCRLVDEE